ncbi:MAG: hypothetical protein ACLP4R_23490, partial [Solirubrobacteraceae bacterium]
MRNRAADQHRAHDASKHRADASNQAANDDPTYRVITVAVGTPVARRPPRRSQRARVEIEIRRARRVEYISNWPRFLKPLYDPGRSDFPSPVLASV